MKVLVTGHKGFIGKEVFKFLSEHFDVDGLDRPDDIGDFIRWASSASGSTQYDLIVHLAAYAALRDSVNNPDKFWENNVLKSQPIFDYCRRNNTRLLYASSAGAYSWWQNPYAITKKVNEIQAPPNSVGMRFFNVWAEEGSRDDMLYEMLKQGTAKYITRHKRDWVHVLDVVRAIGTLIPSNFRGTIDVGTGQMTSVIDLANAMGMGHLPIKEDTPNEPDELCANIAPLMELGWFPTLNILDTVIAKSDSV
tara:strand:- start:418 stop:1170 length:753 start_codon:yes stop_codon:yes gene_type:complete